MKRSVRDFIDESVLKDYRKQIENEIQRERD